MSTQLGFMTTDHHRVRDLAVRALGRRTTPLPVEEIAGELDLPRERVVELLGDLERHLTFLFRDAEGAVEWAYPVTVSATPHRLTFSTGERLNGA